MMWIKICGIRDVETASRVAELGVDAIGLNFYHASPRVVSVDVAMRISKTLPAAVARVGVFVNHSISDVEAIASNCQLDMVQLHGDETSSYLIELRHRLPQVRLIRAWRMRQEGLSDLKHYLEECQTSNCSIAGCLVDAHVAGTYGGSGARVPWEQLSVEYDRAEWPPLILAGGLTAMNIGEAISATKPWGVDVASGVESSPGVKDIELVRQFVSNAKGKSV